MKTCPTCNTVNLLNADRCEGCGNRLPPTLAGCVRPHCGTREAKCDCPAQVVQASSRDTWLHSFGYLPVSDLGAIACTNKRNRALAEHDQLWREHLRRNCSISLQYPSPTSYKSRYKKLFSSQIGPNFFLAHGKLWMWGDNHNGQLGLMDTKNRLMPERVGRRVVGFENIVQVAAGRGHTVELGADGCVWAWGNNSHGQLGLGHTESRSMPQCAGDKIAGFENITQVAAGSFHTVALRADGRVWIWGSNWDGELGLWARKPTSSILNPKCDK